MDGHLPFWSITAGQLLPAVAIVISAILGLIRLGRYTGRVEDSVAALAERVKRTDDRIEKSSQQITDLANIVQRMIGAEDERRRSWRAQT